MPDYETLQKVEKQHATPDNITYRTRRNKLIATAMEFADAVSGTRPKTEKTVVQQEWADRWNYAYHTEMNRLAKEAGL